MIQLAFLFLFVFFGSGDCQRPGPKIFDPYEVPKYDDVRWTDDPGECGATGPKIILK